MAFFANHLALQFLDFSGGDVAAQIEKMRLDARLTEQQAQAVDIPALERFLSSPLAGEIRRGTNLRREYSFTLLMDAARYDPRSAAGDTMLLQGVVDCCFETEEGIVVVDFKTDRVFTDEEIAQRVEVYRPQLTAYSTALEQVLEKQVVRRVLYFLPAGKAAEI